MSNKNFKGSIELISGITPKNKGDFPLVDAEDVIIYEGEEDTVGMRLPEKLTKVGISEEEKQTLINTAVTQVLNSESYKGLEGNIKTNAENIGTINADIDELERQLAEQAGDNDKLIVHYDKVAQKLYLYEKDEKGEIDFDPGTGTIIKVKQLSETIIQGGSSTGTGATYSLSLKVAADTKNYFSVLEGRQALLSYEAKLVEKVTDPVTGETSFNPVTNEKITYSIYRNDVFQKSIPENEIKNGAVDVTDLLALGTNNFKIIGSVIEYINTKNDEGEDITVAIPARSTARWTVNVVSLKLELPEVSNSETGTIGWDATPKTGAIPFVYKVVGALPKKVYFILDGDEENAHIETINATELNSTYTIPKQTHGIHTLEVYCEGTLEDEIVSTDRVKYIMMCAEEGNTTPLIRIKAPAIGEQYSNTVIYFNVYDPLDETANIVEIYENDILKSTYVNIISNEQNWTYNPQEPGLKNIKIKYLQYEESVEINVNEFPYKVSPAEGDLMVDFVPRGRSNQDIDYNVFKNNAFTVEEDGSKVEIPMNWTFSENFDWVNGGWKKDAAGDEFFCVKAGTSVSFDYNLFNKEDTVAKKDSNGNYSIAGTGKEFKLIFKTTNVARADAVWLSCMAPAENSQLTGLEMQAHNAYVKSNFDTLEIPYSEEDIIEFDMNIVPITKFTATYEPELTSKVIPMILTYEDGTPVQPKVITNPATSFKQTDAVPISIGSNYCDVHIYRLKIYERYLSESEILNNFIADARNGEEMAKRFKRNQIYMTGQSSFGGTEQDLMTLAEACPDLRIYLVSAPYFTNNKSDKVENTTIKQWYYKNGKDSLYDNWVAENCIHNGQGTSSNEYGYSGRNLEFNMKKTEFTLADNLTKVSKVPLTPTSVPTNYFNFKINIASSENANNALLQKRYDRYLPYETLASQNGADKGQDVKNSMEFYNCVVFIQETNKDLSTHREFNDTDIHFYGIGNIGDSKKTDSSRLNDKDDTKEFCVEIMDWNRELSNFPVNTIMRAAKYKDKDKNYIFLTDEYLASKDLYEQINGEYVEVPKTENFDSSKYYFEFIDGQYVVTEDIDNKNLRDPEDPESGYEDKTYYNHINGQYVISEDTQINPLKAYYIDILVHDDFSEDYTYGFRYITEYEEGDEVDGVEITEEQADELNESVQGAAKQVWQDFYKFITRDLTTDGKEDAAKVAAWKSEFADWFILDAALYYYLFTLRYTMVDNRAKNSFWHYGKCPDGKYRFEFWDYDNDTALGIDNAGKLEIPFGVEDNDTDAAGAPYFRANDSTFFTRVAKYFVDELNAMWTKIEQNTTLGNAFDSTNFINEFDTWQGQFPEELWRLDYERKYKRTYVGGEGSDWDNALPKITDGKKVVEKRYLTEMMNGRKKYQRRQFERNQDAYMSSKFFGTKNYSNSITLRGSGASTGHTIPANFTLRVIPFNNMYLNLHDGTNYFYHNRVFAGQQYNINLLDSIAKLDLMYIRGASNLQELGDLSLMYLQTATLGAGSKLKNIILGNPATGYSNDALKTLEVGASNQMLEELDIRNLSNFTTTDLPVTGIPSLKRVYAQGSNILTARFANNGLLEEAYLPATLTQLELRNLYFLKTLELEGYSNLIDLTIENCSLPTQAIVEAAVNLKTTRINNINWTLTQSDVLERLYKCLTFNEDGSHNNEIMLTGYVNIKGTITRYNLEKYQAAWPTLTINVDAEDGYIQEQQWVYWYNDAETSETKKLIASFLVNRGETLETEKFIGGSYVVSTYDPTVEGNLSGILIDKPKKPNSADGQWTYSFIGWSRDLQTTVVGVEDIYIYAQQKEETRYYRVEWLNGDGTVKGVHPAVAYGSSIIYEEAIAAETENTASPTVVTGLPIKNPLSSIYYIFSSWDKSTAKILPEFDETLNDFKNIITMTPQFKSSDALYVPSKIIRGNTVDGTETLVLQPEDLYAVAKNNGGNAMNSYLAGSSTGVFGVNSVGKDLIEVQLGYMPHFNNIEDQVLAENLTLNGTNLVATDVYPFATDQSFTLAIDFTSIYNNNDNNTYLMSAYSAESQSGMNLVAIKGSSPRVTWGSLDNGRFGYIPKGISNKAPKESVDMYNKDTYHFNPLLSHREICVIRKLQGDSKLYIYTNNRYSLDDVQMEVIDAAINPVLEDTYLVFGDRTPTAGGSIFKQNGKGIIHYAKIWWGDIGDNECRKICNWTYNKMQFKYNNTFTAQSTYVPRYNYDENGTQKCVASFLAAELLPEMMQYQFSSTISENLTDEATHYYKTDLQKWLTTKFIKAFPVEWQQVINPVYIPITEPKIVSIGGNNVVDGVNETPIGELQSLYIPSVAEVDNVMAGAADFASSPYYAEYTYKSPTYSAYAPYVNDSSRIYKLPNTDIAVKWALRSRYIGDSTGNYLYRGQFQAVTCQGTTNQLRFVHTVPGTTNQKIDEYHRLDSLYGILIGFSI